MASLSSSALLLVVMLTTSLMAVSALRFGRDVQWYWGNRKTNYKVHSGKSLKMSLDYSSGAGFKSYNGYLYGRFDMRIKLVSGNSAGVVTTYYLSSQGQYHDEVDFEFLGNVSGQPYILHTNIFAKGVGGREQRFYLWFDPTKAFHKYSVVWNSQLIILMVDDIAIRVFNNNEAIGVAFPNSQAMNVYSSIWCGDTWATEGGRVKTDWSKAPFNAYFKNLKANACKISSSGSSSCGSYSSRNSILSASLNQKLTNKIKKNLQRVQDKYMMYNYCTDKARFPYGYPGECYRQRFLQ